jgi:hypothetical protein
MYSLLTKKSRKRSQKHGLPLLQQFASKMGLHREFHQFQSINMHSALKTLTNSFQIYENGPKLFSAGLIGINEKSDFPNIPSRNFTDDLLELLTDQPHFAFIQFLFHPLLPQKKRKSRERKITPEKIPVQFDLKKGTDGLSKTDVIREYGEYLFSPRVILVEKTQERLQNKLEQLHILFHSTGIKLRHYSTFFNRFSRIRNLCLMRKVRTPIGIDGWSLMNLISLPHRPRSGYSLVPHKSEILEKDIPRFLEQNRKQL